MTLYLHICGRKILSSDIEELRITEERILITLKDDFINIKYKTEEEIKDARNWLRIQNLQKNELQDAIALLTIVCDNYINSYNQCQECPLHKKNGCIVTTIPINWQEGENNAAICSEDK